MRYGRKKSASVAGLSAYVFRESKPAPLCFGEYS